MMSSKSTTNLKGGGGEIWVYLKSLPPANNTQEYVKELFTQEIGDGFIKDVKVTNNG